MCLVRHRHTSLKAGWPRLVLVNAAKGTVLLIPSVLLYEALAPLTAIHLGVGAFAIIMANILFSLIQPRMADLPLDLPRWARQGLCVMLASALSLAPAYLPALLRA
jgi:hypothetical protein